MPDTKRGADKAIDLFSLFIAIEYAILTQVVKTWFIRRFGERWRWRVECIH